MYCVIYVTNLRKLLASMALIGFVGFVGFVEFVEFIAFGNREKGEKSSMFEVQCSMFDVICSMFYVFDYVNKNSGYFVLRVFFKYRMKPLMRLVNLKHLSSILLKTFSSI